MAFNFDHCSIQARTILEEKYIRHHLKIDCEFINAHPKLYLNKSGKRQILPSLFDLNNATYANHEQVEYQLLEF